MAYLVATAWIKDEAPYLEEWLEFHILQGFDKFYIYDNKSVDKTIEILAPYMRDGIVEYRTYPPDVIERKNFWVIQTTIDEFKNKHNWLFHHSVDEYMFCENGTKVADFLKEFDSFGGVVVPWRLFTSNGHKIKTDGLVIDRFTEYIHDPQYHIKTIINPNKTVSCVGNPHAFIYNNSYAVYPNKVIHNQDGKRHAGACDNQDNYVTDLLRINHYLVMSREEFDTKMNKGLLDLSQENKRREESEAFWTAHHTPPFFTDTCLTKYSSIIKKI